jgi:2,3-bisphosphoglycerate-independent phosphoglycerate mutase
MVGHSGRLAAAVEAIEAVDQCLRRVVSAARASGAELLITADHGNAEQMRDPQTGEPYTAHTDNPVPLVYVGPRSAALRAGGALCDLAPTLLALMGLAPPREMQGQSLVTLS